MHAGDGFHYADAANGTDKEAVRLPLAQVFMYMVSLYTCLHIIPAEKLLFFFIEEKKTVLLQSPKVSRPFRSHLDLTHARPGLGGLHCCHPAAIFKLAQHAE